ncbi:dsDNA nuclease domain-containing protein [Acidisoma cladoniae]|uniref:dsDNA nuclease domain-containing protein n=1 Tax=Acidisoma cladoniae TaxID=3040935 RepID=UPI00255038D0|nr:dsDNA nuclease domain-containing protein [Acidisoma sp. PAMC 29798]
MSGPDNLRGIDYQISYTAYRIVAALGSESREVSNFEIESLDDETEDLNIYYQNGRVERIQIKKKGEAYLWRASELKPVLKRFFEHQRVEDDFVFVTNAPGNADVKDLKDILDSDVDLDPNLHSEVLEKFTADGVPKSSVADILRRTQIHTRAFSSDDDAQPGKVLRDMIRRILSSPPYRLGGDLDDAFNAIWTYIYDCAAQALTLTALEIEAAFRQRGIHIQPQLWRQLPLLNDFLPRPAITGDIQNLLAENATVILFGVGGSGKTALLAGLAHDYYQLGRPFCWISVSPITEISTFLTMISSSLHYFGMENAAQIVSSECRTEDDYVNNIIYALKNTSISIFVDSANSGGVQVKHLLNGVIERCPPLPLLGRLLLSTTELSPYSRILREVNENVVTTYLMPGLDADGFSQVLGDQGKRFDDQEIEELRSAVGGHYLSTVFLRRLLQAGRNLELQDIKLRGAAGARKWLVGEVIKNLGTDERTVLSCVSVFDYGFDLNEAQIVVGERVFSPLVSLDILSNAGVTRFDGVAFYLHETVQPLVYATLADDARRLLHKKLEAHYRECLEKQGSKEEGYPSDKIMKWGQHVEKLADCGFYRERPVSWFCLGAKLAQVTSQMIHL